MEIDKLLFTFSRVSEGVTNFLVLGQSSSLQERRTTVTGSSGASIPSADGDSNVLNRRRDSVKVIDSMMPNHAKVGIYSPTYDSDAETGWHTKDYILAGAIPGGIIVMLMVLWALCNFGIRSLTIGSYFYSLFCCCCCNGDYEDWKRQRQEKREWRERLNETVESNDATMTTTPLQTGIGVAVAEARTAATPVPQDISVPEHPRTITSTSIRRTTLTSIPPTYKTQTRRPTHFHPPTYEEVESGPPDYSILSCARSVGTQD